VITALIGVTAEQVLPEDIPDWVGSSAVASVLNILASSMLAVTTFSLGVMVSAYSAATTNVTPRATRLLISDTTSQNALSTFLGSFLFSLVGIITLSIEGYGQRGRIVLFVVTVGVIVVIVITMLRWMDYLMKLGRVGETAHRLEKAAADAIGARLSAPYLGGNAWGDEGPPDDAVAIKVHETGYVQHVDGGALQSLAEDIDGKIYVDVLPGTFVHEGRAVFRVVGELDEEEEKRAVGAITIGDERTFDQDPRFGVLVLAEVGTRALSDAINDSGTAIDILGRLARVLLRWAKADDAVEVRFDRLFVRSIDDADLVEDAFAAIARDGAAKIEVQVRLQKALGVLIESGDQTIAHAAKQMSRRAADLARAALDETDRARLATVMPDK
jgi:uncharacterized membrane protein